MKKYLLSCCLLSAFLYGCREEKCCTIIDVDLGISYLNSTNTDLLDPATRNGIREADIDIYYFENGVKRRVYNAEYDMPENFRITRFSTSGKYFLNLSANTNTDNDGISTTYIGISNRGIMDTVTTQIIKSGTATYVAKTWLNRVLKWEGNGMDTMTIIK